MKYDESSSDLIDSQLLCYEFIYTDLHFMAHSNSRCCHDLGSTKHDMIDASALQRFQAGNASEILHRQKDDDWKDTIWKELK